MVASATATAEDTFPKLLIRNAGCSPVGRLTGRRTLASGRPGPGARCSMRCALSRSGWPTLGLKRGDKLAIIGANRPRLYWSMCAAQALGAVPVPVYADAVAEEMALHPRSCRGDDRRGRGPGTGRQDSVDLRSARTACALHLRRAAGPARLRSHAAQLDRRGGEARRRAARPRSATPAVVGALGCRRQGLRPRRHALHLRHHRPTEGRDAELRQPDHLGGERQSFRQSRPKRRSSRTCRSPGSAITYSLMRSRSRRDSASIVRKARKRSARTCARSAPTYGFAPPRVYENLLTLTMMRMEDAGRLKRAMFRLFHRAGAPLGRKASSTASKCRCMHACSIGSAIFWSMDRSRTVSACPAFASPIPPAKRSGRKFSGSVARSASTSSSSTARPKPPSTSPPSRTAKSMPTRSGKPNIDVDIRIADNGEVLFKSPACSPATTRIRRRPREAKTADG